MHENLLVLSILLVLRDVVLVVFQELIKNDNQRPHMKPRSALVTCTFREIETGLACR